MGTGLAYPGQDDRKRTLAGSGHIFRHEAPRVTGLRRRAIAASLILSFGLAGCGSTTVVVMRGHSTGEGTDLPATVPQGRPQVVEPAAGSQPSVVSPSDPVGDPNAHAPSLTSVRQELKQELVAVRVTGASYINPLYYVTCCGHWERTDQGVDATMPAGAPILAPCAVKILAIEPGWYSGQPLVYWELLQGPDAGKVQYVAEEITQIAKPGSILQQRQAIARYARSGTGIEFGWSTPSGVTLAVATTGYEEGQITPAGRAMRAWLNSVGAHAGPNT